jgi:hypothetical protein
MLSLKTRFSLPQPVKLGGRRNTAARASVFLFSLIDLSGQNRKFGVFFPGFLTNLCTNMPAAAAAPHGDASNESPSRKLTEEEVKLCADRLSKPIDRDYTLPPLIPKKVISKEGQEKSLARLYTGAIERKAQILKSADEARTKQLLKPTVVANADLDQAFSRLYDQSIDMRKKRQENLEEKYSNKDVYKKFTSKDEELESAKRLCDASVQKAREVQKSLFDKYVLATEPKYAKRTKEELAASIARLTAKSS